MKQILKDLCLFLVLMMLITATPLSAIASAFEDNSVQQTEGIESIVESEESSIENGDSSASMPEGEIPQPAPLSDAATDGDAATGGDAAADGDAAEPAEESDVEPTEEPVVEEPVVEENAITQQPEDLTVVSTMNDAQPQDVTEVLDAEGSVVTVDAPAKADDMDFVVTGEGEVEFDEVNKVLIVKSGNVTVSMKEGVTETTQSIEVAGNNVGLVIDSLTINAPKQAIKINSDASVTLTLEGTSTLTGGDGYAAVEPVYESTEKMASLTIEGDGTLNVTGGTYSAGIGGSKKTLGVYGNITIKSGVINANSGNHSGWTGAAAIGSSDNPANGTSTGSYKYVDSPWGVITIDGGTVTARADYIGAGIGGGNHCDSGVVVINGGTVDAQGHTGIGCGYGSSRDSGNGGDKGPGYYYADVTITGGTVLARALDADDTNFSGAGIGGGEYSDAKITITGGNVTAYGANSKVSSWHHGGAGIGGGYLGNSTITIGGSAVVDAYGGGAAAGIGSGSTPNNNPDRGSSRRNGAITCDGTTVEIAGGSVTAHGGNKGGAGIGSGVGADKVEITISDGIIKAWGGASDEENKRGGAGIGSGYSGTTSGESSKYFVETDTSVTISNGTVLAVGGWGASGIGSGADNETAKSITIADAATIEAYADGTKFAIDTRDPSKSGIDGESCSIDETQYPRNYTGVLLQGTFVFPGEINGLEQDTEGLAPLVVTNDLTGEKKTLTQMPEGYRSFATDVSAAGNYTVFTNDKQISDGKGRYFNVCASETYDESKVTERNVLYRAVDNDLCDNYFLFPVKVIVIEKKIEAESDVNITGLNTTVYFALWAGGDGGHYVTQEADGSGDMWVEKIEIKDGVPQSKAYFVNVVDGEYAITEIASATDGSYLKAGTAFGNYELAKIETTHDGASGDNDGKIDKDQWTDEVTVTNTFKAGSTSVTLGGKKSFTGWPADVEAPVFTYTLSENGSVIDSKTTKGAGDYQFDTITYTETGTHLYTVEETRGRVHGVTYDTRIYNITVEVFNDGSTGKLETKIIGDSNTGTDLDFINTYKAEPATVQFEGTKTLSGKTLRDAEFSFTLMGSDGTDETVSNDGGGKIKFTEIRFDKVGTYTYTVKEKATDEIGIVIDSTVYTLTVKVTDDGSGKLTATVTGADPKALNFANKYLTGDLSVSKTVSGELGDKNQAFIFTVELNCKGEYSYTGDVSGTISSGGTILLKHGQSVTIHGLPVGCEYRIRESNNAGYRVYSEGTTGVIEENKTSHASFTNTKSGVPVTGEKDRLLTYLAMMLTSGLGLLGTGIAEKKRRKRTDHKG